ncbi:glycoside hydrolase family 3 N-terminal domain-containing protein [Gramella sp. MAR_2010_147]|uniref:glycoside hydrolase family 3 N-terminal domain-containing protein n=1 Tax=Gramella sp. MAR_2010_147 TaxID=1250205 RepID=UPI00087BF7B5|nr:glycoside hydrolase family 3 N-terminal domain-containing protein [Gramella sp. MAR_2010_147]SDS35976.1 beta-glucosidase [Gramella sp. MAR_2010_147]
MRLNKTFLLVITGIFFGLNLTAQNSGPEKPEFLQYTNSKWVDSVMTELSVDERIAQLLMIPAFSNKDADHKQEILRHIKEYKIGGLIFMQGNPKAQLELMNDYQLASEVPLLGAIDGEWGLGMRLDNTISYPYQMALGAIQGEELIYDMGVEIARQIKRTGLHVNFGPVVDVNNNPQNPVINYRSFGEDKLNVSKKGIAYMKGMQSQNLLATAKHFPGHGDTDTDSHYALPQINHPFERLDDLEMYPFKELINAGIGGVMVAHLDIPALDSTGTPSTLSKPIITGILKERLGFEGLIVTDAMNMKGVAEGNEPGEVDKKAILAGNDLLEFSEDIPKAIAEIRNAIRSGLISQAEIDSRCRKILAVKQWVGLNNYKPLSVKNIEKEINSGGAEWLNRRLVEASLTLLKNETSLVPLQRLDTLKIASISIGAKKTTNFQKSLNLYMKVKNFQLDRKANASEVNDLKEDLKDYNLVIVGLHDFSIRPRNEIDLSEEVKTLISELSQERNSIFSLFKNPYVIDKLENIEKSDVLIEAYQDSELTQELSAQLIFGGVGAWGKLPVTVGEKFKAGDGLDLKAGNRFKYSTPEDAGMNSEELRTGIDSLMNEAMAAKAIPGGVVLVAKDQKVVFHKAYGLHKYSDTIKVKRSDIYDLASVSKISTALPAIMKLYDEGKFDLEAGIEEYLPYFKNSNKEGIAFRQIFAHQARFKPWIPYWKNTLRDNGSFKWNTFKKDSSARYPVKVSEELWLHKNYKHKIFKAIKKSPLEDKAEYKYSGLVFYLLPTVVERITKEDFETYINQNFYEKLGATTVNYNPSEKFPMNRIVPTESDFNFRHEEIHGNVHDEGAIMMGGISANAGLFANANDLAKLMQMYLNMGEYGGVRYIEEATVQEFTKTQFPENDNHRAIAFDKPYLDYRGEDSNTAKDVSSDSFGHTGFTGIMVWMDPKEDLLYIFLSNRVLPTRENTRLYKLNTRTKIQQILYGSLEK